MMRSRRHAREATLQALYQCDTLGDWSTLALEFFFSHFHGEACPPAPGQPDVRGFAETLTFGTVEHLAAIDNVISRASLHWTVDRMTRVDRNILRLATFELGACSDIPVNVTLNEAIELAKLYGTDDSRNFINGVLDKIASTLVKGSISQPQLVRVAPRAVANG